MSKFDFSALEAAAVSNNFSGAARTPTYALPVEEARAAVKVRDGNKKPAEDGSQALTLALGKYTLPLDVVKQGATRINASAEQVESFTETLLAAVEAGQFDNEIIAAQKRGEEAANKPAAPKADTTVEEETQEAPEGVDLDSL